MTATITEERPATEATAGDVAAAAGAANPSPAAAVAAVGTGNAAMALRDNQTDWTPGQRAMLASLGIGEDATDAELQVFLYECQRRRLDPFAKQIYLIGRWDPQAERKVYRSQTSIDGFRLIARRAADEAGVTLGYEDTVWYDEQGREFTAWSIPKPPAGAKVVVLRDGQRFPASARFGAYAATKSGGGLMRQWATMGDVMISKCAEALALRKAFPEDLGGLYTEEEMMQADNETPWTPTGGRGQGSNGNGGQRGQQNRNGQNGKRGQQAQRPAGKPDSKENQEWIDAAMIAAPDIPTLEAWQKAWDAGAERAQSGAITEKDSTDLANLLKIRKAELQEQALLATQLDPEDSWFEAIAGISSPDDAVPVRTDIAKQFKPNATRYQQLMKAVNGRVQIVLNNQAGQVQTEAGVVKGAVVDQEAAT